MRRRQGRGRPKGLRRISGEFETDYFSPTGIGPTELDIVVLSLEEAEAVRLVDLLGMELEQAAKEMDISRRTLSRELDSARKKLADAIVNGKAIQISGGNYEMVGRGRMGGFGLGPQGSCVCPKCGHKEAHGRGVPCYEKTCPKCGAKMTRER